MHLDGLLVKSGYELLTLAAGKWRRVWPRLVDLKTAATGGGSGGSIRFAGMAGIVTMPFSTSRLTPRILPGSTTPWWLAVCASRRAGLVAAAVGAFVDGVYRAMTANWAQQTFAQDIADLIVGFRSCWYLPPRCTSFCSGAHRMAGSAYRHGNGRPRPISGAAADWTRRSHHDAARADRNHAGDRARRHLHLQAIHRGNQVHANAILAMHPNVIGSQRSATRQAGFLVHLAIFVGCHQAELAA
jgi:hypothetical protein